MIDLKPCPFCGGKVEISNDGKGLYRVGCDNANCFTHVFTYWCRTQDDAAEVWNKRANE